MITTSTGAKKIEDSDNWRLIFGAHNDSVDAHDLAIANLQNGLAYIVGNTNATGVSLAVGQYVYVKGHSTIPEGLRKVIGNSAIGNGGSITTNNTEACSEGGLNSLFSKKASYSFAYVTTADITLYNCTLHSAYKHKVGNLVTYEFDLTTTADIAENSLLISGLEQTIGTKGVMVTFYASHSGGLLHYMLTTGDSYVHARSSIPNDTKVRFTVSYLTATH